MTTHATLRLLPLALSGLLALSACHRSDGTAEPAPDFVQTGRTVFVPAGSPLRARLQVVAAETATVRRQLVAPAAVEADPAKFARIFPPVSGRLVRLWVRPGETVRAGQLLATMNSPDFAAAQADYAKAVAAAGLAARTLARTEDLARHGIAAQKDVEQAQADNASAQSDLASAAGRLRSYGFDPANNPPGGPLRILSPLSGRVVDLTAAEGEYRNDPTAPLMSVADLSTVWLTANVPENDLRLLSPGEEISAALDAYPGETFRGRVAAIGAIVDPDTRTAKVRAVFANPGDRLKPGMFATVTFLDFPETVVAVPAAAVVQMGGASYVYVETAPWTFTAQEVTLGAQQGGRLVIAAGLAAGTPILAGDGVLFQ